MNNKNKLVTTNVYSTTGFSDLISSPIFYPVLILTILLGLSSTFGFLQNPLKLKAVVDIISDKVSLSEGNKIRAVNQNEYSVAHGLMKYDLEKSTALFINGDRYSIFARDLSGVNSKFVQGSGIRRVSFDYDITSRQFWGDLDLSKIESTLEESRRKHRDALITGTPLELKAPTNRVGSLYSLGVSKIIQL